MCKTCTKCGVARALSDFSVCKRNKDGRQSRCKQCDKARNAERKDIRKARYEQNKTEILKKQKDYYARTYSERSAQRAEFRIKNREKLLLAQRDYNSRNRELLRKKSKAYYASNKTAVLAQMKRFRDGNKALISARKKDYAARNKDKISAYKALYYARNIERAKAYKIATRDVSRPAKNARNKLRELQKRQAVPAWSNAKKIEAIYASCARISKCLGTTFHVDHIVPLQSPLVCGLHVFENLQILSAKANLAKSNKFEV